MNKHLALLCLALASATTSAQQAPAATTTTEKFVGLCASTADVAAQNFCHGYSQGVYETYLVTRHPQKAPAFVCAQTSTLTRQQHIDTLSSGQPRIHSSNRPQRQIRFCAIWARRFLANAKNL